VIRGERDPLSFIAIDCAIAAAASWIPACRAVRIDPIVVLREE